MVIDLTDTTSAKINNALLEGRKRAGSSAVGMVLNLVLVTDEEGHYDAMRAAGETAREHPSRVISVIRRRGREPRLDAEIRVGGEAGPGETIALRLYGPLGLHAESVVLPLLLPDTPVVTWWPGQAPEAPGEDLLGALSQRRVTDTSESDTPLVELGKRARAYQPGDTDLAWTRITPWRSLLAAALDVPHARVTGAVVEAEPDNPSAELMALWLSVRLGVRCERVHSSGPGITAVRLATGQDGLEEIAVTRPDGRIAQLSMVGQPDRPVALKRRSLAELIAEELRRLDPDDVYQQVLEHLENPYQEASQR